MVVWFLVQLTSKRDADGLVFAIIIMSLSDEKL